MLCYFSSMKKLRHLYILYIIKFIVSFFRILPRCFALFLGNILGIIVFKLARQARQVAEGNIALIYPNIEDNGGRRSMAIKNFRNIGKNLADALRLSRYKNAGLDRIVNLKNGKNIQRLLERGKGLVVITAHLGCWELIPAYFSQKGYSVNIITRQVYDERVNSVINRIRENFNVRIIDKERAPVVALKRLLLGETVGILMDQSTKKNSVSVNFMGKKARTPVGPAYLAMKTSSPVLPVAIYRQKNNKHLIEVGEEVILKKTRNTKEDLLENTRRCSKAIEQFITKHPTEWVWFHKRWS